jgi:hypothetical protein
MGVIVTIMWGYGGGIVFQKLVLFLENYFATVGR